MKTFTKRAVTTLATLALALSGALATAVPATAATSKKVTGPEITTEGTRSTVRVTTRDVKIKKGKFTAKDWLKIHVDVPDSFYYADGTRVDATWWASISYPKGSSTTTCGSGGVTDTYSGDGTYVASALKSRGLEKKSFGYYYHGAGRCTFEVKVYIRRTGDYAQDIASYYETITVKNVSHNNIAPSKTSISIRAVVKPTTVSQQATSAAKKISLR